MITPIKTLNINQIAERKDDLLMSSKDIKELARNERNKAIDEFITAYERYCEEHYGDVAEQEICDMEIVAEQLKGGAE